MGGLLILTAAVVPTLLWADLSNPYVWIAVLATVGFGAVGFTDDYLKITRRSHHGLIPRYKMAGQIIVGLAVGVVGAATSRELNPPLYSTRLIFPFFKNLIPDLGCVYVLFAVFVLVCATNAVNLTDGLDGLAISTFGVAAAAYTALAYVTGHAVLADYLLLVRFPPAGELTIFCGALVGASLGFLWYNSYPAEIFMGDVGSLALGGALGTVAILIKQELLLPIVGGVFVLEGALGDHPGRLVQADREARLQDGAAPPSFRADRLERAEGHHAVPDRRGDLCALQPDDIEAAVMVWQMATFRCRGRRVVVVGAARSGIAAAELLRPARGAGDDDRTTRGLRAGVGAAATRASRSSSVATALRRFDSADLVVHESRRAAGAAGLVAARDARRGSHRRSWSSHLDGCAVA